MKIWKNWVVVVVGCGLCDLLLLFVLSVNDPRLHVRRKVSPSPISVLISVMPCTLSMSASRELGSGRQPKTSEEALRLLARVRRLLRGVVEVPLVSAGDAPRWWG